MLLIYCEAHHHTSGVLCAECKTLLEYADQHIRECPLQPRKPVCATCQVHCYIPTMRADIKKVMRYAGPRMLLRHPLLTFMHFFHRFVIRPGRIQ